VNYKLAYRLGFHPWEDAEEQAPFGEKIGELFEREESGRQPPYGLALDLGTGSGIWGVRLAKRGWQVTGVDLVDEALRRARERAQNAGVAVRLVHGDVTALREAGVGSDFRLVLDTGTFHGLNRAQREAMGREVSAIVGDRATVLMLAWAPRRRGPLPGGANRKDIEAAFPGWTVTTWGQRVSRRRNR
jgi:SAM-dependent methyltransferase